MKIENQPLTFFEWGKAEYSIGENYYFSNNKFIFTEKFLQVLEEIDPKQQIFRISHNTITPQKYVGFFQANGISIQILPKLFKTDSCNTRDELKTISNKNLLLMLSYGMTNLWSPEYVNCELIQTHQYFEDFFKCLVNFFSSGLLKILSRNQNREYIVHNENLHYIKGKINLKNYRDPSKIHIIPCTYHKFSSNSIMNQTFKYCSVLLLQYISGLKDEKQISNNLKKINSFFLEVDNLHIRFSDTISIKFNRLNNEFEPYFRFCQLFLSNYALSLNPSHFKSFSFLFLMQDVYQNFITQIINCHIDEKLPGFSINYQYQIGHLVSNSNDDNLFKLRPDIIIEKEDEIQLIIDLKYKRLDFKKSQFGIANQDIYQMYVYGAKTKCKNLALFYPIFGDKENDNSLKPWKLHYDNSTTANLSIKTIDLSIDLTDINGYNMFVVNIFSILKELLNIED